MVCVRGMQRWFVFREMWERVAVGVHVRRGSTAVDALAVLGEADLAGHVHTVDGGARLDEGPVEEVTVVGDEYVRPHLENVVEPLLKQSQLILLVENDEVPLKLWLGRVFEVVDVSRDDLPVGDEVALPVDHVRDHHDLVNVGVGELEGQLGGLDVEGEDDAVGTLDEVLPLRYKGALAAAAALDGVPTSNEDGKVNGYPRVERAYFSSDVMSHVFNA